MPKALRTTADNDLACTEVIDDGTRVYVNGVLVDRRCYAMDEDGQMLWIGSRAGYELDESDEITFA